MDPQTAIIVGIPAILIAIIVHEFSHGYAAYLLGDNTAKDAGRLTLNPIAHIDFIGTIIVPLIMLITTHSAFGWAKPVPFNPYNLKYPRFGPAIVAIAGPLSNLIVVIVSLIVFKLLVPFFDVETSLLMHFIKALAFLNSILLIFNLIPIPPLDGSKVLFSFLSGVKYASFRDSFEKYGPITLMSLIIMDQFLDLHLFVMLFNPIIKLVENVFI
jgi:Zn-dependent protease